MKKLSIIATTALLFGTAASAAQADTQLSQVSGYTTLIAIGNARGVQPALTVASLQSLKTNSAAYKLVNEKLQLSPTTFANLLSYGNKYVPNNLVVQAIAEASVADDVAALIRLLTTKLNAIGGAITPGALAQVFRDPQVVALINKIVDETTRAVTPVGNP